MFSESFANPFSPFLLSSCLLMSCCDLIILYGDFVTFKMGWWLFIIFCLWTSGFSFVITMIHKICYNILFLMVNLIAYRNFTLLCLHLTFQVTDIIYFSYCVFSIKLLELWLLSIFTFNFLIVVNYTWPLQHQSNFDYVLKFPSRFSYICVFMMLISILSFQSEVQPFVFLVR